MRILARRFGVCLLGLTLLAGLFPAGAAAEDPDDVADRTPPRLSYVEGEASFWRPGAEDWAPAQVNTPLAPGDELHTGHGGNLEMQLGSQAFIRSWGNTHLGLVEQQPDFLQLKVTTGYVAVDLRRLAPGRSIEIDTPHAAFTLETAGFYRVDVGAERTAFVVRRSGRATVAAASGEPLAVAAGEQVVLDGATIQRAGAPGPDVWDTWNEARTAHLVASTSARYVAPDVAGVADLDQHGTWRAEPDYGSVWVPSGVPAGWAPYSTGRWVADPYYGWTWVDTAPWGWAPYHYGRWVYVRGFWAWAPGPVVVRPVYAPALVAFFGSSGVQVTVGSPFVSWVALGWGEPVVPWWRTSRFHGRPWWGGWGGPRIVNNVVVHRTTVVHVHQVREYRNVRVRHAVVGVREGSFGRRPVHETRVRDVDVRRLRPIHGRLDVRPDRSSFVAADGRGTRPPEHTRSRPIVSRRQPGDRGGDRDGQRERRVIDRTPGPERAAPAPGAPRPRPEVGSPRPEPRRPGPVESERRDNARRESPARPEPRRPLPVQPERGGEARRESPAPQRRAPAPGRPQPPRRPEPATAPAPRVIPDRSSAPERPRPERGAVERERPERGRVAPGVETPAREGGAARPPVPRGDTRGPGASAPRKPAPARQVPGRDAGAVRAPQPRREAPAAAVVPNRGPAPRPASRPAEVRSAPRSQPRERPAARAGFDRARRAAPRETPDR
jgi:hypothetical protein